MSCAKGWCETGRLVGRGHGLAGVLDAHRRRLFPVGGLLTCLRRVELSCAVVPVALDVVLLGQGRNFRGVAAQLADPLEHHLGPAVVSLDLSLDLDLPSRQTADVAHLFQIAGEDDYGKGTDPKIFAEIEEVHAALALLHTNDFSGDAPRAPMWSRAWEKGTHCAKLAARKTITRTT